jgi:LPS export ABC transporter permease LptG/LPS export ABC transporter permease LptF
MFKTLDRYVVREVLPPFFLGLLVLTFILEMPPILEYGEKFIEKGVDWLTIIRLLATLLPQALGLTIPMSLLLGILIAFGRLSADREFVAMQACGISIFRMLQPVALLALPATIAAGYMMIVALPNANQTFREITFGVVAAAAEGDVKPRVFFEEFSSQVIYVRDVPPTGGWRDVFMADSTNADHTTVYLAKQGRLIVDRGKKTVELSLEGGSSHTTYLSKPDSYDGSSFDRLVLKMDAAGVFPRTTLLKGDNEMTIADLRTKLAEAGKARTCVPSNPATCPEYGWLFTIQQKFSIPAACVVLALLGLGLGVTNRKDGKLASFALGFGVIFVYYTLLWTARAMAFGGRISPTLAPWIPNIALGAVGIVLLLWRAGSADQPIWITLPAFWRPKEPVAAAADRPASAVSGRRRVVTIVIKVPHLHLPRPRLLDLYVGRQYLRVFGLACMALLGIFYIATFMDVADKLFRGTATTGMLLHYFYFETPRYVTFIIPIAALISTLVVVGLLTKNSELIVMRACGVSLYRSAVPLVLFSVALSGVMYELQEQVVPESHRRAERLRHVMRGLPVQTFGTLDRRWIVGHDGDIYHYDNFDPRLNEFRRLTIYDLDSRAWRLASLTYAKDAVLVAHQEADGERSLAWQGRQGWTRSFSTTRRRGAVRNVVSYAPYDAQTLPLEPPSYFKTDAPEPDRMSYEQLARYIVVLRASGFHVVPYMVQLQRKVAFPFITLIMTLLAVPFAVTTGRRGALYGIGIGIVLAIMYWTMQSVFAAIGAGGVISPVLAAWAPNILFGAAAMYMMLTVRT